ncbi:hypothetical protein FSP39_008287 [Pinctada imbricata]|uniref:Uncharacterized protein n=1 Tax=Pinctada imbricata TaxID=66713 RepID=A0AA88YL96_PINIB|nr:hypothetical protein FSP39_008287 [Pinctada imbricata]
MNETTKYEKFDVQVSCSLPSDMKCCQLLDMTSMPDGRLLVLDSANSRMKLLDQNFQVTKYKLVEEGCHSLSSIDSNLVGVLKTDSLYTYGVSGDSMSLEEKVALTGMHYGIISNQNIFILIKLVKIEVYDKHISKIGTIDFSNVFGKGTMTPKYLALNDMNHLLFCEEYSQHLICMDIYSNILWNIEIDLLCSGILGFSKKWIFLAPEGIFDIPAPYNKLTLVLEADVSDKVISCSWNNSRVCICDSLSLRVFHI